MTKVTLPVSGMHCASCALLIEKTLKKQPGVNSCNVNYANEKINLDLIDKNSLSIPKNQTKSGGSNR